MPFMGKGPDQGDFETITPDTEPTTADAEPTAWPTEPDVSATAPGPSLSADPTDAPTSPSDEATTAVVGVPDGPRDIEQLPTTSGTEVIAVTAGLVAAVALIGTGAALALQRRRRPHW